MTEDKGISLKKLTGSGGLLACLMVLAAALALAYLFSSFTRVPVNPDAGYYLSISKEVMEGATPTVDVATSYSPGVYYLYAAWFKLVGVEYSKALLLIYLVHVINGLLLYWILSSFVEHRVLRILICFSYFYSTMLLEGYYIELEPFQVLFILSAYVIYLKNFRIFAKHALAGFFLGCSVMFKQYSLLVLFGFLVTFWSDFHKKENGLSVAKRILITMVSFAVPFVLFVVFTDATWAEALRSLANFRKSPLLYATRGGADLFEIAGDLLTRTIQMNWLFIPLLIYLYLVFFRRDALRCDKNVVPIFLAASLPLVIRQYGHYFQLIAPWSYILLGIVAGPAAGHFIDGGKRRSLMVFLALFLTLSAFIVLTPSFYSVSKVSIAFMTFLFLFAIVFILCFGMFFSRFRIDQRAVVAVLSAVVFFETLFLSLKLPFGDFENLKKNQTAEAVEVNRLFSPGSFVYVLDYPQLYVTCGFRNPLHDYDLVFLEENSASERLKTVLWDRIDAIIMRKNSPLMSTDRLNDLGYKKIGEVSRTGVSLFRKK